MKVAIATLVSDSPYSQARHYKDDVPALPKELPEDYERRTWQERLHVDNQGRVVIPGSAFANCIKQAAKRLKIQVPGKGRVEFTKYFEAGIMVPDNLTLLSKKEDVACDRLFVPSDGRRGGPKRVMKYFPRVNEWSGKVTFYIFDDLITESVFLQVLKAAGMLVGIGRFRPENCGYYGRFTVSAFEWVDNADSMFAKSDDVVAVA